MCDLFFKLVMKKMFDIFWKFRSQTETDIRHLDGDHIDFKKLVIIIIPLEKKKSIRWRSQTIWQILLNSNRE